MLRAVLDANVYVSATLRPEGRPGMIVDPLLRAAAFELVLTPAIVDEVLGALAPPLFIPRWTWIASKRTGAI